MTWLFVNFIPVNDKIIFTLYDRRFVFFEKSWHSLKFSTKFFLNISAKPGSCKNHLPVLFWNDFFKIQIKKVKQKDRQHNFYSKTDH